MGKNPVSRAETELTAILLNPVCALEGLHSRPLIGFRWLAAV
jgi:hypothetical protein